MALRQIIDSVTSFFGDPPPDITYKDVLDEDIRKAYPQYAHVPDEVLAAAAAKKDPVRYGFLLKGTAKPVKAVPPAGLVEAGNIDLTNRPRVKNPDGSISTVRSMGVNLDGKEVLLPTVSDDGRILSPDQAIQQYKTTGKHLGIFDSPEASTTYAKQLHQDQARSLAPGYVPDSIVAPANVPRTMRSEQFYQRYPDEAKNEAAGDLAQIRAQYPAYAKISDDQLAAAAEKNDPVKFKGLTAKLKAPDIEKARKEMLDQTFAVSEEVLSQLKTSLGNTTGAIPVQKFREGFNKIVSPKIEQAKAAVISKFAPSEDDIVRVAQETGKIDYAAIALRTALQTTVSQVPSSLEDISMVALAPGAIKGAAALEKRGASMLAGKYPVLSEFLEKIYGNLKGPRWNPEVMPEGFKPPAKPGKGPAESFSFATPEQKALPAGEKTPALPARAPAPGIAGTRPDLPKLQGGVEGPGFKMNPSPDAAAFMEHLGYSPKRGDVITRSGYRPTPEPAVPPLKVRRGALPLSFEQAAIENRAANLVETKHPELIREYRKRFGNVIDTDKARELFPDYAASPESRSLNAGAVHEPASTIVSEIYRQELAKPIEGKKDTVVFTAGGGGVGKTESLKAITPMIKARIGVVYDGTFSNPRTSAEKINQALASGRKAEIVTVFRDPQGALEHVLKRAMKEGRTVPLKEWVKAHNEGPNSIRLLAQRYKDNPNVTFWFIDNSLGKGNARSSGVEVLDKSVYTDYEAAKRYVYEQRQQGKISEAVYRGTTGESSGLGTETRPVDGGLAEQPGRRVAQPAVPAPKTKAPEFGKPAPRAEADLFGGAAEDLLLRGEAGESGAPVAGTGEQTRVPGTAASFEGAKPAPTDIPEGAKLFTRPGDNPGEQIIKSNSGKWLIRKRSIDGEWTGWKTLAKVQANEKTLESLDFSETKSAYKTAGGSQLVPLDEISTDAARFQPRRGLNESRVKDLADMMNREGYKHSKPITLWRDPKNGKLYVLAGHHRLAAAWRTGMNEIPSVIQGGTEEEAIAAARRSNSTRAPMSAIEEAKAFKAEIDRGASLEDVAKNYGGIRISDIQRKLDLNNLPPTLQDLVDQGQFPVAHAIELGRAAGTYKFSPTLQQEIFNEIVKKMDVTPGQFRTMMDTLGPAAAKQIDMGLGFALDQGIMAPLREMSSKMGALEKAKKQLNGFVKYIDAEQKAGRKVTGAQLAARNTAERAVNRLNKEILQLQRSVGRAAKAKIPLNFARRGETGSVTLGPDQAPESTAGPATNDVQDHIGSFSDSASLKQTAEDAMHQLYQDTIDRFHSISRYTKMATEGYTKPIKPGENPVLLARSYLGVSGKADTFLRQKTFRNTPEGNIEFTGDGLDEVLRPMRKALPDLDNYLVARRTIELAKRDIETGVPRETAEAAVAELEAKYPQIRAVADGIQEWNDSLLQYLVDSGRIGEQNYEAIKAANQFYAPMQRVMDEAGNPEFTTKNRNVFDRVINPIKKMTGSKRKIISPIESMVRNTFTIMDAADRNAVARAVVNLRNQSPEVAALITPVEAAGRGTITVYENGKPVHYEVPKDLLATMQGLNEEATGMLAKILSYPASLLRAGATLTPEFAARNPIRDQWNAMINSKFGFTPGWDFQKGFFSMLKADESYARWQASGGAQSFMVSMDKAINDVRYKPPKGYASQFDQYVKNPLKILQDLSEISEKPTRLGVFKKAKAGGASDIEAGFEAREATTDFGRRGARTKAINAIYAFFNARLQGVEKTARAFKERPLRSSLAAAPLILASVYNYLTYKDDEEFKELPKWRRLMFWNFKVDTQAGKQLLKGPLGTFTYYTDDHAWIGIPKGDVGIVFGGTAEKILEFVDKHDPEKLAKFAGDIMEQISPIDIKGGGYIPTGIKPIVENVANYNFFRQRPIVPEGKQDLLPALQYNDYDSEISRAVGRALNVSPSKVTNLISGTTGGLGRYVLDFTDSLGSKAGVFPKRPEQPRQLADIPLVRGFVARNPRGFGSNSVYDFYQNLKQIDQVRNSIKKMPDERRRLFYENPEVVAYKGFDRAAKALSVLRKKRDQIMKSDWPLDRKKQYGDRIDAQVTSLARRMNEEFEKLKR